MFKENELELRREGGVLMELKPPQGFIISTRLGGRTRTGDSWRLVSQSRKTGTSLRGASPGLCNAKLCRQLLSRWERG